MGVISALTKEATLLQLTDRACTSLTLTAAQSLPLNVSWVGEKYRAYLNFSL